MTSEKLYSVKEVAEILGLTENNIKQYRWRHGIGVIQKGKLYFSDSDTAFIRARVGRGRKPKEPKEKEKTEYEKFIASFPCRLLTAKELSAVIGMSATRVTDLLDIYAVIASHKSGEGNGKKRKLLWKETDIPKMQEDLAAVSRSAGYRKRASGATYTNSPERLAEIKEKYKNGVTKEILAEWLGNK